MALAASLEFIHTKIYFSLEKFRSDSELLHNASPNIYLYL